MRSANTVVCTITKLLRRPAIGVHKSSDPLVHTYHLPISTSADRINADQCPVREIAEQDRRILAAALKSIYGVDEAFVSARAITIKRDDSSQWKCIDPKVILMTMRFLDWPRKAPLAVLRHYIKHFQTLALGC
jgi:hypothetical protein